MEEERKREMRGIGVKHDCNIFSCGERLRASPEVFVDSMRFPHVVLYVVGALYWQNSKGISKGG